MKLYPILALAAAISTGCTSVHVTSDPPGARVYNACGIMECGSAFREFRPYDNVQGTYRGQTPVSYTVGYIYDNVRVVWPDGEDTGWTQQRGGHLQFHFTKRNAVPQTTTTLTQPQRLPLVLPARTWQQDNIAVANLTTYALSQAEVTTLTEKIHSTLVEIDYFSILSRSEMQSVLETQAFQRSDACGDTQCLVEMGKLLAVRTIVGGSLGKVGNTFSLALRLVDVETGRTELSVDRQLKAEADELLNLVYEASRELAFKYAQQQKHQ